MRLWGACEDFELGTLYVWRVGDLGRRTRQVVTDGQGGANRYWDLIIVRQLNGIYLNQTKCIYVNLNFDNQFAD